MIFGICLILIFTFLACLQEFWKGNSTIYTTTILPWHQSSNGWTHALGCTSAVRFWRCRAGYSCSTCSRANSSSGENPKKKVIQINFPLNIKLAYFKLSISTGILNSHTQLSIRVSLLEQVFFFFTILGNLLLNAKRYLFQIILIEM